MHPRVGALDVAPVVYLDEAEHGAAIAEALLAADAIGAAGIPVFLYGELADGRTRAELREGGPAGLAERGTPPDYGPARAAPDRRARRSSPRARRCSPTTSSWRRPRRSRTPSAIAARLRTELPGREGARARTSRQQDVVQVSTNVEDHRAVTLADVLAAVRAEHEVRAAELVAPAPEAALAGWPDGSRAAHAGRPSRPCSTLDS